MIPDKIKIIATIDRAQSKGSNNTITVLPEFIGCDISNNACLIVKKILIDSRLRPRFYYSKTNERYSELDEWMIPMSYKYYTDICSEGAFSRAKTQMYELGILYKCGKHAILGLRYFRLNDHRLMSELLRLFKPKAPEGYHGFVAP